MVGLKINKAKSELEPVQDIQFLGLRLRLGQGSASLPISKAREIITCACRISSQRVLSYREVFLFMGSLNWASNLIPLGQLYMRPLQRQFYITSDRPVCSPLSIGPFSPCYPTQAVAGPIISHIRNPDPAFPGGIYDFSQMPVPRAGALTWGIPRFRVFGPIQNASSHQLA